MNQEWKTVIDETIQTVINEMMEDIQMDRRHDEDSPSLYAKTEFILYSYPALKSAIKESEEEISVIRKYGATQKSKSITAVDTRCGYTDFQTEFDRQENQIEQIRRNRVNVEEQLALIERVLAKVKDDPYYAIIEMKYFQKKTMEQMAQHFGCDVSTIRRNKNRLRSIIRFFLFEDDVLNEMLGWLVS